MAGTWMSPEAVAVREFAQELLTDRHGRLAQYFPLVVTDWKSVDNLNLGGRASSAEVSLPLSNGEEQFILVLHLAKVGKVWWGMSFVFQSEKGEAIMSRKKNVRTSVLVKTGDYGVQWKPWTTRHEVIIPARYEHLLYDPVGEPVWAGHRRDVFEEILTVPVYAATEDQYRLGDIQLGTKIFDSVPTEAEVVEALLEGQKVLWQCIEAQRFGAARARGSFRSSHRQVQEYFTSKRVNAEARKAEEDLLLDHPTRWQKLTRPRMNRLIGFARWLLAEYGGYNPETGYIRVVIPTTAVNEAGHLFGETHVYANDACVGLSFGSQGFEMQLVRPLGEETLKWGITRGATYQCVSPIEWAMPELEYSFPGINQAAWEFATAPDESIEDLYEVIWLDDSWVRWAMDHVG